MEIKHTLRKKRTVIEELNRSLENSINSISSHEKNISRINDTEDENIKSKMTESYERMINHQNRKIKDIQSKIEEYNKLTNEEKEKLEKDEIILFSRKYSFKDSFSNFMIKSLISHERDYNLIKNLPILLNNEITPEDVIFNVIKKDIEDNNEYQFDVAGIMYDLQYQIENSKEEEFENKTKEEIIIILTNKILKLV